MVALVRVHWEEEVFQRQSRIFLNALMVPLAVRVSRVVYKKMYKKYKSCRVQENKSRKEMDQCDSSESVRNQILRRKARAKLAEGVSISGLLELYYAPNGCVRLMWILCLSAAVVSIFYHSSLMIILYLNSATNFEIIQTDKEIIPFPKVTVCSPSGINKSWAAQQIKFPPKEKRLFDQLDAKGKEQMIEALSSLQGDSFRYLVEESFDQHNPRYFAYHHILIETFKNMPGGYIGMAKSGATTASCEQTVRNCRFAGEPFNCCEHAVMRSDEDGPCFDLGVDIVDRLSNYRRPSASPFSAISLTFDLRMDWNYILPASSINGFSIHVGDPYVVFGRPVAIPAGTHSVIDVSQPRRRFDKTQCTNSPMPDTKFGKYDPNGLLCKMERYYDEFMVAYIGCQVFMDGYVPNETDACTGAHILPTKIGFTGNILENTEARRMEDRSRASMFDIMHSSTRCLPFCDRWEYSPRPSFSELIRWDDHSSAIGRSNSGNVSVSRVTVFIAPPFYISRREQGTESFYKTFMLITDLWALYVGGSVVTLAEIIFYGTSLCGVYYKTAPRRNQVGPV